MKSNADEQRPLIDRGDESTDSRDIVSLKGFLQDGHGVDEGPEAKRRDLTRYLSYGCALLSW